MPSIALRWPPLRRLAKAKPHGAGSASTLRQPPLQRLWTGLKSYFAHHGVWAPGVKLLRQLHLREKMAVIAALVLLPLSLLIWQVVAQQVEQARNATQRLAGLRVLAAVSALEYQLAAALDGTAGQGAAASSAGQQAFVRLQEAVDAAVRSGLPLQLGWQRSRVAVERMLPAPTAGHGPGLDGMAQRSGWLSLSQLREEVAQMSHVAAFTEPELHASALLTTDALPAAQQALAALQVALVDLAQSDVNAETLRFASWAQAFAAWTLASERADRLQLARQHALVGRAEANAAKPLPALRLALQLSRKQVVHGRLAAPVWAPPADRGPVQQAFVAVRQELHEQQMTEMARFEAVLAARLDKAQWARNGLIGAMLMSVALTAYLVYSFFHVMRGGLALLNQQIGRMADGDLSSRAMPRGVDEVAQALRGMTRSLVRLSDLMASVNQGVGGVKNAAQMVANGNAELSKRNQQNSERIVAMADNVARSTTQLRSCGRQVEEVVTTVGELRLDSARNRKQMQLLRERMAALRSQSREIAEMVVLIDNVAFRTNLLALNASVQASKAGESGRGFAVVAQEVRALAAKGAESARKVGEIARRSTEDIELSHALVEQTGQALVQSDQHVDRIHQAMDSVARLTHAGEQESTELVEQLSGVKKATSETMGLMEQVEQASDGMRSLGDRLAYLVGRFRLS